MQERGHRDPAATTKKKKKKKTSLTQVQGAVDRDLGADKLKVVPKDQFGVVELVHRLLCDGHVVVGVAYIRVITARVKPVAAPVVFAGRGMDVRLAWLNWKRDGRTGSRFLVRGG